MTVDNIGSEENQSAKKKDSRKKTLNKQKLVSTTELTSKRNSHKVSFSYIRAASMVRLLATWTLNPKTEAQISIKPIINFVLLDAVV